MPIFLINGWNWLLNNKWAQYLGAALLLFAGYHAWKRNVEAGVRRLDRERQARVNAEERARIESKRREITQEISDDSRRADEAVSAVRDIDGPSQLRERAPSVADELLGPARSSPR